MTNNEIQTSQVQKKEGHDKDINELIDGKEENHDKERNT